MTARGEIVGLDVDLDLDVGVELHILLGELVEGGIVETAHGGENHPVSGWTRRRARQPDGGPELRSGCHLRQRGLAGRPGLSGKHEVLQQLWQAS